MTNREKRLLEQVRTLQVQLEMRKKHYPIGQFQRLTAENRALRAEVIEMLERDGKNMDNKVREGECVNNKAPWTRMDRVNHRVGMWLIQRGRT